MKKNTLTIAILAAASIGLIGCKSGDSDDNQPTPTPDIKGQFVDSPVAGLVYSCDTGESGKTGSEGEFTVKDGAVCSFSIDSFAIGSSAVKSNFSVITPYETAKNVEEAIKIASILQTIDSDGNPENGINVAGFSGSTLSPDLLQIADEATFLQRLTEDTGITNPVSFDDAKNHLNESVGTSKGYHSQAVQDIVTDLKTIINSGDIEKIDLQARLADYHSWLDRGDESNGADIESFRALLSIAEVLNNEVVANRVEFSGDFTPEYTELLPKALDLLFNENLSVTINPEKMGTTEDVAKTFYQMAEKLIDASNKLEKSFQDESYVAMYDKPVAGEESEEDNFQIDYQDSLAIRTVALATANVLSTLAAYDLGSDHDYLPQVAENLEVEVVKMNWNQGPQEPVYDTHTFQHVEFDTASSAPDTWLNNEDVLAHRDDPKYLRLAKSALDKAAIVLDKIDLSEHFNPEEEPEVQDVIASLNAHLSAKDGKLTPFEFKKDNVTYRINLQAFYNPSIGLDRSDYRLIDNKIECGDGMEYYPQGSKLMNEPICKPVSQNGNFYLYLFHKDGNDYFLNGSYGDHSMEWEPVGNDYDEIVLSCKDESGADVDC